MAASEDHALAFELWSEFNNKTVSNVELSAKLLLEKTHPGYHVTRTKSGKCDLMGYAEAKHAIATRDNTGGLSDAARIFRTRAGPRMEEGARERVEDQVDFGKWLYSWDKLDFIVYLVQYYDAYRRPHELLFVLAKSSDELVKDGHHVHTDNLLLEAGRWTKVLHDEIYVFDDSQWKKDKNLFKSVRGASWDNVVLEPVMKRNLIKDVLTFFDNQALYQSLQVPWKRGIILHGLPGNGKTISIKALINSLDARSPPVPSLYVKSFDGCSGQKWCINAIFSQARRQAPCLLIFEDLDSLVEDKTRSYFLNEVDGLESNEGILMIGSTNHLEKLDPAITKRPSRFDRKYHFKVPNEASRASYAEFWAGKFATRDDVDFPDEICPIIAKLTADFSFAYLQELFLISLLALARGDDEEEYQEEEEDEKEGSGAPSDSGSATDAVVVPRPVTGSEDNGSAANAPAIKEGESKDEPEEKENEKKQKPKPKSKRVMPVVEIPEHLQDHRLLKIIKKQTKMLLEQMDSTSDATDERDEEDGGSRSKRKMRNQRSIMRTMASMRAC